MEEILSAPQIEKKRLLREITFVSLYALSSGSEVSDELFDFAVEEHSNRTGKMFLLSEEDRERLCSAIENVTKKQMDLDALIQSLLVGWKNERLPLVDLCILRFAVYDLLFNEDVPKNVTISEAVLLADTFSDEKDKKFINGVLSSVLSGLKENGEDAQKLLESVRG